MITFSNGKVAYFDNGSLGGSDGIFFPKDIPIDWRPDPDHGAPLIPVIPEPDRLIIENAWHNVKDALESIKNRLGF